MVSLDGRTGKGGWRNQRATLRWNSSGVGIRTIRFLLCLPLQVFQLNERAPQLFVVSSENFARTFRPVWIVLKRSDVSGLVFNPSPETSHVLLHSLQLKERRHIRPPEPPFGDAHACHIGDRAAVLKLGNEPAKFFRSLGMLEKGRMAELIAQQGYSPPCARNVRVSAKFPFLHLLPPVLRL